jgi:misacylated tRNA(Ala) deacylase
MARQGYHHPRAARRPGTPLVGEKLVLHVDWPRRYKLMRMHTACHLLSVVCQYPDHRRRRRRRREPRRFRHDRNHRQGRGDGKDDGARRRQPPVYLQWITDEELAANPGIVKSKNVRPPMGLGRVSLVCIGENAAIDSQPCGGTHVSETQEVGQIHIAKIEKKGKENRRFRIRFGAPGADHLTLVH